MLRLRPLAELLEQREFFWSAWAAAGNDAAQISPSSREASTVDLFTEFTGLITQKACSESSKIITIIDQLLDELINIIR